MASYKNLTSLTQYPVPALVTQRRLTAMFSDTPGETVQPFPYWMDNVVPTQRGVKSISWQVGALVTSPQTTGLPATLYYFPTENSGSQQALYTNEQFWLYDIRSNAWKMVQSLPSATRLPSRAYIRNESYVFFRGIGLKKVTSTGLEDVVLNWGAGVTPPDDLIGCSGNSGYLILYSLTRVYWSSPLSPTVFSISEGGVSTGAGSTLVQGLSGDLITIEPIAGGSILYTNQIAMSMRYTTNPAVPFAFAPIQGCRGIVRQWHVAFSDNADSHYIWAVAGLQRLGIGKAEYVLPEFTAYFARNALHKLEGLEVVEEFASTDVKLSLLSGDLLSFSVGPTGQPFQYTWLYDLGLGRWGRITAAHWHIDAKIPVSNDTAMTYEGLVEETTKIMELRSRTYQSLRGDIVYSSERPMEYTYYGADGVMHHADFADFSSNSNAKIVIGDYRITFNRSLCMDELKLRMIGNGATVQVVNHAGQVRQFIEAEAGRFVERAVGHDLKVVITGDFELTDILVSLTTAGSSML